MSLPTRRLGRSDLELTTVGLGAWAMGGGDWAFGWGEQDDKQSVATIHYAVDQGVNWVDTAAVYGLGHSEEVVGEAMRQLDEAERPYVFTKGGMSWDEDDRSISPQKTLEPRSIRRECEASLRRLGVERIDLYQFHWPDDGSVAVEDSWAEMLRLIDEGKVRHGGVSNFDVDLLDRCEQLGHVTSLQPPFSLIRRDVAADLLPWCVEHETGVLCYSPMQAGILTERFSRERVQALEATDWRRQADNFQEPALSRNLALRDALRPIAERRNETVSAVAVAWVLAWPGVTAAIVGGRSPDQVDGWIGAAALELTADDLTEITEALGINGSGSGPTDPQAMRS